MHHESRLWTCEGEKGVGYDDDGRGLVNCGNGLGLVKGEEKKQKYMVGNHYTLRFVTRACGKGNPNNPFDVPIPPVPFIVVHFQLCLPDQSKLFPALEAAGLRAVSRQKMAGGLWEKESPASPHSPKT